MIRVLCADISFMNSETYQKFFAEASAERRAKADRCFFRRDKHRCIAADALLRHAAGMCGITEFTVEKGTYGKPRLKGHTDFHYNLSHSGNWVVIAFGNSEVGVDVEKMDMDAGKEEIARRWFAKSEQEQLFKTPEGIARAKCFFGIWTQKESILKYLGVGLSKGIPKTSADAMIAELEIYMYGRLLDGGHCLSICTKDPEVIIDTVDIRQL